MLKIALVCQHGASTGLCVRKMVEAAKKRGLECEIAAYSDAVLESIIEDKDCILLGPQLAFKKDQFRKKFVDHAEKITVINTMDFGMMNGDKILQAAIDLIESIKG